VLRRLANAGSCEFGAEQAILVASETTKRDLQARVGSRALVLTVLESKGLEFQVLFVQGSRLSCMPECLAWSVWSKIISMLRRWSCQTDYREALCDEARI